MKVECSAPGEFGGVCPLCWLAGPEGRGVSTLATAAYRAAGVVVTLACDRHRPYVERVLAAVGCEVG